MNHRIGSMIGWTSAILVSAFNAFAAVMKFVPVPAGSAQEAIMQSMGMTSNLVRTLGVIEGIIVVLFLIPRTSTIGVVLMVGYLGGALATNLTHGATQANIIPIYVLLILTTISAYYRNPELLQRLRSKASL